MKKLLLIILSAAAFTATNAQTVNGLLLDATNTGIRDVQQYIIDSRQQTSSELKASPENLLTRMNAVENNMEVKTNKAEK